MTDASDELALARANAEGWAAKLAELEAQQAEQTPESPANDGYGVAPDANRLGPKEDLQKLWKETSDSGLRADDIAALAVARLAQGALAGDPRYLVQPTRTVRVTAGE